MKSIVEGAYVGTFDPDYYKSDRKDQKIDELRDRRRQLRRESLQAAIDMGPSSARRRTSPATWSTNPAIA